MSTGSKVSRGLTGILIIEN